jgi:SAM-dependent methyltransferase
MTLVDWATLRFQFRYEMLRKAVRTNSPRILDLGCGPKQPYYVRLLFPNSVYTAVDILPLESLSERARGSVDHYLSCDLMVDGLSGLADGNFDVIILSHIIEHLLNGSEILDRACKRLAPDGLIYCEYPRFASTRLPSAFGTLNFWDDPTHVRLYSMLEILNVLNANGIRIEAFGVRRFWRRIAVMPIRALHSLIREGRLRGGDFWDLLGFAEYALGRRPREAEKSDARFAERSPDS